MHLPEVVEASRPQRSELPTRMNFIEGLRGLAALIVMAGHAIAFVLNGVYYQNTSLVSSSPLRTLVWPLLYGTQMVWLFIFVSGFGLYYSEARRCMRAAPTTLWDYARRRAWRILPTYYAALFVSLAMILVLPGMHITPESTVFHFAPLTWGGFISHLFLVHNLNLNWISQINGPLWSIATEAQLYLLFPLLFLAMRRWNPYLVGLAAICGQLVIQRFVPFKFFELSLFFVSGMLAAHYAVTKPALNPRLLALAAMGPISVGIAIGPVHYGLGGQLLFLAGYAPLVLGLMQAGPSWWNVPTWRITRFLGERSYSLYVFHYPILFLLLSTLKNQGWSTDLQVIVMLAVGSVLSVAAASLAYVLVERWSLKQVSRHRSTTDMSPSTVT